MKANYKKLSIILYCNGNFDESKDSLYSILDQKLSHLFYEILIINDNATKRFTKLMNDLIAKEELINTTMYSLENYSGLPMAFNFLLKNNIIQGKYFTIVKSGDTLKDGWLEEFMDKIYPLDRDLYLYDLIDVFITPREEIGKDGKNYDSSRKKMIVASLEGEISQEEAITTKPLFLGKIWRTKNANSIRIDNGRILYQDIFMYFQLILKSKRIWYEGKIAGTVRHKPWIPKEMDEKRIELLSLTLNKMISRNPYVNGHILQLLALALKNTSDDLKTRYLLSNHKYLKDYNCIIPIYALSRRSIIKSTKPFVEFGEIKEN